MKPARNLALVQPEPPPAWHGKPHDPRVRGLIPAYRAGQANHCPGCGRAHWLVGRLSAECAFCGVALPIISQGVSNVS